jgi:hypothetical protein
MKRFIITITIEMVIMLFAIFIANKINNNIAFFVAGGLSGALCMGIEDISRRCYQ